MIEETGIAPEIGKLLFMQQFADEEKEYLELFFHIKNTDDYSEINLEETSHGMLELTRSEYVDPKASEIMPAFLMDIDYPAYIEGDKPVFIHTERLG